MPLDRLHLTSCCRPYLALFPRYSELLVIAENRKFVPPHLWRLCWINGRTSVIISESFHVDCLTICFDNATVKQCTSVKDGERLSLWDADAGPWIWLWFESDFCMLRDSSRVTSARVTDHQMPLTLKRSSVSVCTRDWVSERSRCCVSFVKFIKFNYTLYNGW